MHIEVIPDEVQRRDLDAYERIGEDVCEVVERRPSSLVVVRTVRRKFVLKGQERGGPTQVQVAAPLELPLERGPPALPRSAPLSFDGSVASPLTLLVRTLALGDALLRGGLRP